MKIVALAVLMVFVTATTCGGNCPSDDCPRCPCGEEPKHFSGSHECGEVGEWSQTCCRCIADHESGDNSHAANYNTNGTFDIGFWQINDIHWGACNDGSAPCGIDNNRSCAHQIWKERRNWSPWSTCGGCGCCSIGEENLKLEAENRLTERGWNLQVLDFEVLWFLVDTELDRMAEEAN